LLDAEKVYSRALAFLQSNLRAGSETADEITECLTRMDPMLQQAQELEVELAPLRAEWSARSLRADSEMKQILARHETLLGSLIQQMNQLENQLKRHRSASVPEIDRLVRHQQMQRAYQQGVR